jgi:predicted O-linked N-acetylglucosamine transferase (SPINDLY family)
MTGALRLRAALLRKMGANEEAIGAFRRLLDRVPTDLEALVNLAALLKQKGESAAAVRCLTQAVELEPAAAALRFNLGNALIANGELEAAVARFDEALSLEPTLAQAHNNRGSALKRLGRIDSAYKAFEAAARLDERNSSARNNLGIALSERGEWGAAVRELEAAVQLNPDNVESRGELALALVETGEFLRAFDEFQRALALAPEQENLCFDLGVALMQFGHVTLATQVLEELVRRRPEDFGLLVTLANLMLTIRRPGAALTYADRARALQPDAPAIVSVYAIARQQLCEWGDFDLTVARLRRLCYEAPDFVPQLALAGLVDDPYAESAGARNYANAMERGQTRFPDPPPRRAGPLRVAYLSPDYADHPVGVSVAELLERHNRARVEVIGISTQRREHSPTRARLMAACDRFHEMGGESDRRVASLLRELDVDVAIDLAGYTVGSRPRIFTARAARVQAGYLGYPGTTGGRWLDYLIADREVVPPESFELYSERIVWLPVCFFPSDTTQVLRPPPTRQSAGLPDNGVVFACLTKPARIVPDAFDAWLRILAATNDSILWMNGAGEVREGLRAYATARGVDPKRLVFAERVPDRAAYLGRLALADCCLDTFPYAGHSSVRDALWSGVPVVTLQGRSFPARVAPSLLRAAGLGDWVATDWDQYERLAVAAAKEPDRIARAKRHLALREQLPLFDMRRVIDSLESAYEQMLSRWSRGEPSSHLDLGAAPTGELSPVTQNGGAA